MTRERDIVEHLRRQASQQDMLTCEDMLRAADEIERLQIEKEMLRKAADADGFHRVLAARDAEVAEWKERWAAERRDHETTIRHFHELMNEVT